MSWLAWLYTHWPEFALSVGVLALASVSDVLRTRANRRRMSDLWTVLALAAIWSFRYWPAIIRALGEMGRG